MKASEIKVGGLYRATVSGKHVTVRVDAIDNAPTRSAARKTGVKAMYRVTNLATGRKTTFKSAAKFRGPAVQPGMEKLHEAITADVQERFAKQQAEDDQAAFMDHSDALETRTKELEGEQSPPFPTSGGSTSQPATPPSPGSPTVPGLILDTNQASSPDAAAAPPASPPATPVGSLAAKLLGREAAPAGTVAGYKPTAEQEAILEAARQPGLTVLVVAAGAGTGKTSTLKMLEEVLPGQGQYTAFNSSLVAESKAKFRRAACNTTHSLAFRSVGRLYAHRLGGARVRAHQVAAKLGIEPLVLEVPDETAEPEEGKVKAKTLPPALLASMVTGAIKRFCQSADDEVGLHHIKRPAGVDRTVDGRTDYTNSDRVREHVLPYARAAWADLSSTDGNLPFSHDVYVKVWQLGRGQDAPVIQADYILLDEAQDTAPVFLDVISRQSALVILVGDDNQQIYCQPEGTMVRTPIKCEGRIYSWKDVPIESLQIGDRVVTYSQKWRLGGIRQKGCVISDIVERTFSGKMVVATVDGLTTKYTPDHHCVVMLGSPCAGKWVVYLQRRGDCYRAGACKGVYESQWDAFGPWTRAKQEQADGLWVLHVCDSKEEALALERLAHEKVPSRCFKSSGGTEWWETQEPNRSDAAKLLTAMGLDINSPLLTRTEGGYLDSTRTPFVTAARNLIDGMLMLPASNAEYDDRALIVKKQHWRSITVARKQTTCQVISISVEGDHTYIADGIVTHNSWRGAVNAMATFPDAPRRLLSQSFRFGQSVADVANSILEGLDEPTDLVMKGLGSIPSRVVMRGEPAPKPDCVLTRTNAAAVGTVLRAFAEGRKPHLIGGGAEVVKFVQAAQDLQRGRPTSHPELCCFENWAEVQAFVKEEDGEDLKTMVKLIDEFQCAPILAALEKMPDERNADLVVCTAHKSKGREWGTVQLAGDFPPANKMTDADRRLLYVAATRAQHCLDLSICPPFLPTVDKQTGEDVEPLRIRWTAPRPTAEQLAAYLADRKVEKKPVTSFDSVADVDGKPVIQEHKTVPPANGNGKFSWAKFGEQWVVRGPAGATGRVTVARANGTTSQVDLGPAVKTYPDAVLYRVVR